MEPTRIQDPVPRRKARREAAEWNKVNHTVSGWFISHSRAKIGNAQRRMV